MPYRSAETTKYRKERREEGIVLELDEEEGENKKAEIQ